MVPPLQSGVAFHGHPLAFPSTSPSRDLGLVGTHRPSDPRAQTLLLSSSTYSNLGLKTTQRNAEEPDKERDGRGSSYHQEEQEKSVRSLLISYLVTAAPQVSHLQWQMLGRLPQVMVLLIDRCCITIQTIIPVSQLPLWVLRRAGAVLPQRERGVGTERRHRGAGASPAPLQGSRSLPGSRTGRDLPGFCGQKDHTGAG